MTQKNKHFAINPQPKAEIQDPWPNVWRVYVDGEFYGQVDRKTYQRIQQECHMNGRKFQVDNIGRQLQPHAKRLYES
jgi:(2Fe-2S) ferredoxin